MAEQSRTPTSPAPKPTPAETQASPRGGSGGSLSEVPAWAAESSEEGATIPEPTRSQLSGRLGFDVGMARIHADGAAVARNRELKAIAHTVGRDVFLGEGRNQPNSPGYESLLAHELTHVVQQLSGSQDGHDAREREAHAVAQGALALTRSSLGPPRLAVDLHPGDLVSITIVGHPDGGASFTGTLEGGGTVAAGGTVQALPAGSYWARRTAMTLMLTQDDGSPMAQLNYLNVPPSPSNAAFLDAAARTNGRIRLEVTTGAAEPGSSGNAPDPDADLRRQLNDLPDRIKAVLFGGGPGDDRPAPEHLRTLLRIAALLADLTDDELAEYADRTTEAATDPAGMERSVTAWIAQLHHRQEVEESVDTAMANLLGLDAVYDHYVEWCGRINMMRGDTGPVQQWEGIPTAQLPATHEGSLVAEYFQLRRELEPHGFSNLTAFTRALEGFETAFAAEAYLDAMELLDRHEHTLLTQQGRYGNQGRASASLRTDLAPARASFQAADAANSVGPDPSPSEVMEASREYQRHSDEGRQQVRSLTSEHPLIAAEGFPLETLGRSDDPGTVMAGYITDSLEKCRETRRRLQADHRIVLKLDRVVARTRVKLAIRENSIWDHALKDLHTPSLADQEMNAIITVFTLALMLVAGSTFVGAAALATYSTAQALETYEDYASKNDAYGAQLLSEEPSLGWVIFAVVCVVADMAAVTAAIRPIRPALQAFQRTGNIAELETAMRLARTEERIQQSILRQAEMEVRARGGWAAIWETWLPPG
ncbi:MAG: DUF4157 domain-containing protein, partial [Marmoricola sp.]